MVKKVSEIDKIIEYFNPVEGGINLYYGRVGNGKTYAATADILDLARAGNVIKCNWKIDVEDFDQRSSFIHLLVHLLIFRKRFIKYPLSKNIQYFDPDEVSIADISTWANCHVFIDEGQWILDSYEGTKFSKEKRKVILHTRHYNRTLNIITQRPTAVHVSARANVERFYKCEKILSWPFLVFRRTEFQDLKNDTVDEDEYVSRKTYFASRSVLSAYNTLAMRGADAIEQRVNLEAWDYGLIERLWLFFSFFARRLRIKAKPRASEE